MSEEILGFLKAIAEDVSAFRTEAKERFDKIENSLDKLETEFDEVKSRLGSVETRLGFVELKLEKVEKKVERVEQQSIAIGYELKDEVRATNGKINRFEAEVWAARAESSKNRNDIEELKERISILESNRAA